MKFICTQENFLKGLSQVVPIAGRNTQLPILEFVHILLDHGVMRLTATDLEIGVQATVVGKIEETGVCTVLARPLLEYMQQLPKNNPLTLTYNQNSLRITTTGFSARFPSGNEEDFPLLPTLIREAPVRMAGHQLSEVFSKTIFAAARDDTRPEIHSVFVYTDGGGVITAATDSFRLSEGRLTGMERKNIIFSFLLPLGTAQEVVRLFNDKEFVDLFIQENHILFVAEGLELSSRLVDGKYPDYQQIIPHDFVAQGVINRDALVRALKTLLVFLPRDARRVRLLVQPKENRMQLTSGGAARGEGDVQLDFEGQGQEVEVLFNIQYLLEGLQYIRGEEVKVQLSGSSEPAILRAAEDKDFLYVVMPIQATK